MLLRAAPGCDRDAIRQTAGVISGGGLAVIPTDTVYGLAVRAGDPEALQRIFDVKGREAGKPIPFLAADRASVEAAGVVFGEAERRLADAFWPGPLTLVLAPSQGGMEGFRVPDMELTRELLAACGGLLRVTSANISGEPPALDAAQAMRALGNRVDIVLDAGRVSGGVPSTVVRVEDGVVRILRPGAIASARLASVVGMPVDEFHSDLQVKE